MTVMNAPASRIARVAAADALLTSGILVLGVCCAFAFYATVGLGGLIPIFLIGSAPLGLVATLDILSWRRISGRTDTARPRTSAGEATGLAGAGIALLLFGGLATLGGLTAGGANKGGMVLWTQQTAAYLLLTALGTQVILVALTLVLRRTSQAIDRSSATAMPGTDRRQARGERLVGASVLAVLAGVVGVAFFWIGVQVLTRGGWYLAPIFIGVGVVCGQGSRLAWRRRRHRADTNATASV